MKNKKNNIFKIIIRYLIYIIIALAILGPYFILVNNSFKRFPLTYFFSSEQQKERLKDYKMKNFTIEGYKAVFRNEKTKLYFLNSIIVSTGTTLISVFISLIVSYALVRMKFKWKKPFEMAVYSTQMFPSIAFVVPYFVLFVLIKRTLGIPMQNTYHGLILTYTSFSLPFCILMLKNYLSSIPKSLDEQAMLDGCSKFQIITRIVFPLALPGIITVSIYSFVMSWNEILFASTLTQPEKRTVAIGFLSTFFSSFAEYFATYVVISLPVIIIFALLQKQLVKGLGKGLINIY